MSHRFPSHYNSAPLNLHAPHEEVSQKGPRVQEKVNFTKSFFVASCLHKVQRPEQKCKGSKCAVLTAVLPTESAHMPAGESLEKRSQRCYLSSQLALRSEVPFQCHVSESEHIPLHLLSGFKSPSKKEEVESGGTGMHVDVVNPCSPIYLFRQTLKGVYNVQGSLVEMLAQRTEGESFVIFSCVWCYCLNMLRQEEA